MAATPWSPCSPRQKNQKLWLYDLNQGTASPFTFGEGDDLYPAWSPDGQQVAFASTRGGSQEDIYVKPVGGGSSEQLVLSDEGNKEPDRWSSDGRYILFDYTSKKTKATDIWALPMFGDRKAFPVVQSPAIDYYGMFSPDGKWVAYDSDESGRAEIYVVAFPREASGRFPPVAPSNLFGRRARSCSISPRILGLPPRNTPPRARISWSASPGYFLQDARWEVLPVST
jgi:Tol biopolymer transport system component